MRMREPIEWEVDSSLSESDLETADLRSFDPDMSEYGKSLGVTQEDQGNPDILWVVHQAFHSPLPGSWTEHVDAEDRMYYHNSATDVSTWNHPMDDVYRDLIQLIKKLRPGPEPLSQKDQDQRCAQAVQDHLLEVHGRFVADLGSWSGPFRSEDGEEYFFNERTQISTWVNPLEDCEIEMSVRQAVLSRCLLPSLPDGQRQLDVPDSAMLPSLHLPILPTRGERAEPERDQEAFASARSFYTARESPRSARSGSSPHSASGRSKGSESPPLRSKGCPVRALISLGPESHENQMQDQSLDDTRTTATSRCSPKIESVKLQESHGTETKVGHDRNALDQSDDEMDLTFGCSAMPKVQLEEHIGAASTHEGDRDSDKM
mmetsp:Transcript_23063/g.37549  ORF Transcript_23063/g.37549 Transcript_23063/m.37549 type:complete len:375 (-) Transcript_23063:153-1277(-)